MFGIIFTTLLPLLEAIGKKLKAFKRHHPDTDVPSLRQSEEQQWSHKRRHKPTGSANTKSCCFCQHQWGVEVGHAICFINTAILRGKLWTQKQSGREPQFKAEIVPSRAARSRPGHCDPATTHTSITTPNFDFKTRVSHSQSTLR